MNKLIDFIIHGFAFIGIVALVFAVYIGYLMHKDDY